MAGVAALTDAARVRALNDAFRRSLTGGRVVVTVGVAALPETTHAAVLSAVRAFDRFDPTDDSHGEQDFGAVAAAGMRCFWKIDCYDHDLSFAPPDPADPTVTTPILTVMPVEEY
ncbi:DUF3768 domain-containing protein [Methylobacterium sp. WL103]|uniref:DUF3768 domain-containing protein n=1 Tax=Methylobacterium sp. WL103 TaxID=2603891 RepID=UPI0011C896EF|nr:DUF3768 domain-containing protein [Methylobacterium sp. WL103]TXN06632.1 DUF3768 domain-containing protein [Methylobacterium sp. WL103]